jgi:Na+-transporting methylmalonyl-CoA/oxaloacetate decarboxylase beta subunit
MRQIFQTLYGGPVQSSQELHKLPHKRSNSISISGEACMPESIYVRSHIILHALFFAFSSPLIQYIVYSKEERKLRRVQLGWVIQNDSRRMPVMIARCDSTITSKLQNHDIGGEALLCELRRSLGYPAS